MEIDAAKHGAAKDPGHRVGCFRRMVSGNQCRRTVARAVASAGVEDTVAHFQYERFAETFFLANIDHRDNRVLHCHVGRAVAEP